MNARLPEPFRPGDPVTGLRAPLNELRALVEHLLKNHIKSGPGIYINAQSGHLIISTQPRPQLPQPRRSGGAGIRYFQGTLTRATPPLATFAEIKAAIAAIYQDAETEPATGDRLILIDATLTDRIYAIYEVTSLLLEPENWLCPTVAEDKSAIQIGPNRLL